MNTMEVAKVLVSDWEEDELPRVSHNPVAIARADGSAFNLVEHVCRIHAEDCKQVGGANPLIMTVPQDYLSQAQACFTARSFGLSTHNFSFLVEDTTRGVTMENGKAVSAVTGEEYLIGGGWSLRTLVATRLLRTLWNRGVRWLLVGEMYNLGCRVSEDLLELLEGRSDDGLIECMPRKDNPRSKILFYPSPQGREQYPYAHERRFPRGMAENASLAAVGTFWIKCESLVRAMKLAPGKYFASTSVRGAESDAVPDLRDGILSFRNGLFVATFPVCDVMKSLRLEPVEIPRSRFAPFWERK